MYVNLYILQVIYYSIKDNNFNYLSLILKYLNKNKVSIENGINFKYDPLNELLSCEHVSNEWFELYFDLSIQSGI